jgi:hypothetical protein
MSSRDNHLDQSRPVRPGFVRIPDFMDVAAYDDAAFIDYTKDNPFWQTALGIPQGRKQDARWREAHFNAEHLENSVLAHQWNEFVAKRKLLLALRLVLADDNATIEAHDEGSGLPLVSLNAEIRTAVEEAIAYAEGSIS